MQKPNHTCTNRLYITPTQNLTRCAALVRVDQHGGKMIYFCSGMIGVNFFSQGHNDILLSLGIKPRVDNLACDANLQFYPLYRIAAGWDITVIAFSKGDPPAVRIELATLRLLFGALTD